VDSGNIISHVLARTAKHHHEELNASRQEHLQQTAVVTAGAWQRSCPCADAGSEGGHHGKLGILLQSPELLMDFNRAGWDGKGRDTPVAALKGASATLPPKLEVFCIENKLGQQEHRRRGLRGCHSCGVVLQFHGVPAS
jgi:hypothetical protein